MIGEGFCMVLLSEDSFISLKMNLEGFFQHAKIIPKMLETVSLRDFHLADGIITSNHHFE